MAPVIKQQNVRAVPVFERGDRAEIYTGEMKAMADNDRRRAVRLRPKLAA